MHNILWGEGSEHPYGPRTERGAPPWTRSRSAELREKPGLFKSWLLWEWEGGRSLEENGKRLDRRVRETQRRTKSLRWERTGSGKSGENVEERQSVEGRVRAPFQPKAVVVCVVFIFWSVMSFLCKLKSLLSTGSGVSVSFRVYVWASLPVGGGHFPGSWPQYLQNN